MGRSLGKKKSIFKRVVLVIFVIIFIIFGVIVFFSFQDLKQEDILKQEIINYSNMDLASDDYSIYVKTKGDYAYIEEAVKKYYKDLSDNVKIINYYLESNDLKNILSFDKLNSERPNFVKSYATITVARNKVTNAFSKISNLCDEKTVRNLVDKEKIDEYDYKLYEELMLTKNDISELSSTKGKMENLSLQLNNFFDKVVNILDFLKENNDNWDYRDNQLYFDTTDLVNKYNSLYQELVDIASSMDVDDKISKKSNDKVTV